LVGSLGLACVVALASARLAIRRRERVRPSLAFIEEKRARMEAARAEREARLRAKREEELRIRAEAEAVARAEAERNEELRLKAEETARLVKEMEDRAGALEEEAKQLRLEVQRLLGIDPSAMPNFPVEDDPCVVCQENPKTHALVPCGHQCLCAKCAKKVVMGTQGHCPLCRRRCASFIRIFK
jgi:DNA repair exonuclease SbcCD ATPase subunit